MGLSLDVTDSSTIWPNFIGKVALTSERRIPREHHAIGRTTSVMGSSRVKYALYGKQSD